MQAIAALPGEITLSILPEHDQSETAFRDLPKSSRLVLVVELQFLPNKVACSR